MAIKLIDKDFKRAEAILKDALFKHTFKNDNLDDLKNLKLLKAREENIDFELELANMICGDNTNFPYRSSYYMTKFFQDLGFDYTHDGTTRRFWMKDVLEELDIRQISFVIEKGLFRKRDYKNLGFRNEETKALDDETYFKNAIKEFKHFINESISINETVDLASVLDLNLNVELLFDRVAQTKDEELNNLLEEAKSRFLNPKDKQVAVEKLWDAFERIKTYFGHDKKKASEILITKISGELDRTYFQEEFRKFTKIGNDYRIRHHETSKKEIKDDKYLTYLFFSMLSLIDLCLLVLDQ